MDDVPAHLVCTHQQVEPVGTGEELAATAGFLVQMIHLQYILQRKTFRRSGFPQVCSPACLSFVERILVESGQRTGRECEFQRLVFAFVQARASDDLKGEQCSSPYAYRRAFERAERRVERDRQVVRKVGRRLDRKRIGLPVLPSFNGDDSEPALLSLSQPAFSVDHPGKFARRASVEQGDGKHSDKASVFHVQHRAVHTVAGIRAVEHDDLLSVFRTGLHHIVKGADVCEEACANVLQVEYHCIGLAQLVGLRLLVFSVERNDGNARPGVFSVADGFSGIGLPAYAVFRSEKLYDVYALPDQRVGQVDFAAKAGVVDR